MVRQILLASALLFSSAALACPGGKCPDDCDKTTKTTAEAAKPAEGTKVVLSVTGMSCGACASKVSAKLLETDGVKSATVDHATGKAEIIIDSAKTSPEALATVVTNLGYTATVAVN